MLGGKSFYSNAEGYAHEILQQRLMREAQKSAHQTMMELSAMKWLFSQGQFMYCIPFGGLGFPGIPPMLPLSPMPPPEQPLVGQNHQPLPLPPALPPSPGCAPQAPTPLRPPPSAPAHSTVHVNIKNTPMKNFSNKPGIDECNIGKDGIDVIVDLREYLPAEICLNVDERNLEIKACHIDSNGVKTFARKYELPACIILDTVKSILSHDGFLIFSAAWCKME